MNGAKEKIRCMCVSVYSAWKIACTQIASFLLHCYLILPILERARFVGDTDIH